MINRTLDRVYVEDWRSLNYLVSSDPVVMGAYRPRSYTWTLNEHLDQGSEGACVGFSFTHELAARPQEVRGVSNQYAFNMYQEARAIDRAAGHNFDEGATILAGAKACLNDGFYSEYRWGLNAEDVARGVAYFGPCVLGMNWYRGMSTPNKDGWIEPTGSLDGGHAIVVVSVKVIYKQSLTMPWQERTWRDVDFDRSYLVLHNSWGPDWGQKGRCRLSLTHVDRLLRENGDACFPRRTRLRVA